jgi:hypothetical protein
MGTFFSRSHERDEDRPIQQINIIAGEHKVLSQLGGTSVNVAIIAPDHGGNATISGGNITVTGCAQGSMGASAIDVWVTAWIVKGVNRFVSPEVKANKSIAPPTANFTVVIPANAGGGVVLMANDECTLSVRASSQPMAQSGFKVSDTESIAVHLQ